MWVVFWKVIPGSTSEGRGMTQGREDSQPRQIRVQVTVMGDEAQSMGTLRETGEHSELYCVCDDSGLSVGLLTPLQSQVAPACKDVPQMSQAQLPTCCSCRLRWITGIGVRHQQLRCQVTEKQMRQQISDPLKQVVCCKYVNN